MTYLHFIVYALVVFQIITIVSLGYIYETKSKPIDPDHNLRMLSWQAFHDSVYDFCKKIEEHKKYFDERVREEVTQEIQTFIASKYQEYWEKQFFMNKPDTKNG